jgi:hypothetical protein
MKPVLAIIFAVFSSSVAGAQSLGNCPIFPTTNPWNQRVDSLPVHWNSAAYIANVGGTIHVHPDFGSDPSYGIPWIAVNASQPFVPIDLSNGYIDQSDPGPMPIPLNAPIESGSDSHVLVVDTSNHHLYELYQGSRDGNGWAAMSSAIFALDSNNYRPDGWTSCDAAGLPIFPGLVRLDECKQGEIKHALRFTVSRTQKAWIFPARHEAGSTADTTVMPMGLRFRLKASFDDSKDTGYAKVIITALKRYGLILADNGSDWYISGETNINWPDDDISQLKQISGNDFEAVYTYPTATYANEYPTPVIPIGPSLTRGKFYISSNPIGFGKVQVGSFSSRTVTVKNIGDGQLLVAAPNTNLSNPDFTLVAIQPNLPPPYIIQPGDSVIATIQFSPSIIGLDSASFDLTVAETANDQYDTNILLIGQGFSASSVTESVPNSGNLTIVPNPTAGPISFHYPGNISACTITLFDPLGRKILKQNIAGTNGTLDLSSLPNGTYLFQLLGSSGLVTKWISIVR